MNITELLNSGHQTVLKAVEELPETMWEQPGACGDWSIKDIIAHLASFEAALAHVLQASDAAQLDNLDPYRRFERTFPHIGAEINAALNRDPIGAALDLLDVYERHLDGVEQYSGAAANTVRGFLLRNE